MKTLCPHCDLGTVTVLVSASTLVDEVIMSLLLLELAEKDVYSTPLNARLPGDNEPSVLEGSRKSLVSLAFPHFSDVTALLIATGLCWRTKPSWFKQADRTSS